ncbi:unnamed protein product [Anisakis simplex]|uniref:Gas vesicle protein n=1 Tax=Anisakis simplex TaxID=6269 RepID=A0A0M3J056_ANISI|nr:unnamed protein product [Anisakis simplex]
MYEYSTNHPDRWSMVMSGDVRDLLVKMVETLELDAVVDRGDSVVVSLRLLLRCNSVALSWRDSNEFG